MLIRLFCVSYSEDMTAFTIFPYLKAVLSNYFGCFRGRKGQYKVAHKKNKLTGKPHTSAMFV